MAETDYLPRKLTWLKAICPICGKIYPYLSDSKPKDCSWKRPETCGEPDCIYAHIAKVMVK